MEERSKVFDKVKGGRHWREGGRHQWEGGIRRGIKRGGEREALKGGREALEEEGKA